jgi:hypothetical protein
MKRYLSDCAAAAAPGATVPARTGYSCSATLYGACFELSFAALPSAVMLSMAQVFQGPPGPKALPILLIDPTRPIAYAASETTIYRMNYTNGLPAFAAHATTDLAADWPNRASLTYTELPA